jgi:drug/metabolite transporter (DMT)-like permease
MPNPGKTRTSSRRALALLSLLGGAALWGIIWYPYRKLEQAGFGGAQATLITYLIALTFASMIRFRAWFEFRRQPWLMLGIALAAGWSIISYVIAVLQTEVVRVLLLFYLAPVWTLPLARIFLREVAPPAGYLVLGIAVAGAMLMLSDASDGSPLPHSLGDWLALSAGFAFACSNILVRKAELSGVMVKSMAVWVGTVVIAGLACALEPAALLATPGQWLAHWPLLLGIGASVLFMSLCVQYGFTHLPANQAMIILLFELVVAAAAAYWLAGETLSLRDWIGGAMIIGAGLCSDRLAPRPLEQTQRA